MKAVYLRKFNQLIKTHELVFLGKKTGAPASVLGVCEQLNPFFIQLRYPDYEEDISGKEASGLIECAKKVVEWAKKSI
ncbi:HEPN domain-containing protein [Candidatus Micrarchaeota archaeon]|nr:HEPN domain-containing protein [Candidatus Micrarchaeota archaeon]